MQLHLTWTTPENNVRVNDRCEGSWRVFNDTGWVDDMLAPVPPMSHINNYTITFNFPGEVITISSGCISITPLPFWLLHPTSSLHFPSLNLPSTSALSSIFGAPPLHRSTASLPFYSFSICLCFYLPSSPSFADLRCRSLSLSLSLPSSCAMAGSCDVIYPTYGVAMAPVKPMALWVNTVPHDWRFHQ